MKKLVQIAYLKRLSILTAIVFTVPILPLIVLSIWTIFMVLFSTSVSNSSINLSNSLFMGVVLFWMLGGAAGLLGAVLALFKIHTKTTLRLFIYGAGSYSIVVAPYIAASLGEFTLPSILLAIYLVMTLVIIAVQIVKLYENIQRDNKSKEAVI